MLWHMCALGQHASQKRSDRDRDTAVLGKAIIHFLPSLSSKAISVVRNSQCELASLRCYMSSFFFFFSVENNLIWVEVEWQLSCIRSKQGDKEYVTVFPVLNLNIINRGENEINSCLQLQTCLLHCASPGNIQV